MGYIVIFDFTRHTIGLCSC